MYVVDSVQHLHLLGDGHTVACYRKWTHSDSWSVCREMRKLMGSGASNKRTHPFQNQHHAPHINIQPHVSRWRTTCSLNSLKDEERAYTVAVFRRGLKLISQRVNTM